MQPRSSVGDGAKCAVHRDHTATATCARCGNFTCAGCSDEAARCPACRTLTPGEPIPPPRWRFWALNVVLVGSGLLFFAAVSKGLAVLGWLLAVALPVLAIQEPLLRRHRSWWAWLLVFLLSMWTFFFVLGFASSDGQVGSWEAGSLIGRLDGGVRSILFGTLFGGWLFPLVVVPNFLLGKWMFGKK